jgi:hypothetical protein
MEEMSVMKCALLGLLAIAALAPPPARQTFTGIITDSMCANADHSHMRMGPTDAECVVACIEEHEAAYVLSSGKNVYQLSDQKAPAKFAARKVTIVGALDTKTMTIAVESIAAAR